MRPYTQARDFVYGPAWLVLREAGLIEERPPDEGRRVRLCTLRPEPMNEVADWLADVSRAWRPQLDSFKDYVALRTAQPKEKSVITRVKPCWPERAA